jgi:hypothetical protein
MAFPSQSLGMRAKILSQKANFSIHISTYSRKLIIFLCGKQAVILADLILKTEVSLQVIRNLRTNSGDRLYIAPIAIMPA